MAADLGRRSCEALRLQRRVRHALRRVARPLDQRRLRVRRRPQADAVAGRAAVRKPRGLLTGARPIAVAERLRAKGRREVTNYAIVIPSVATRSVTKAK